MLQAERMKMTKNEKKILLFSSIFISVEFLDEGKEANNDNWMKAVASNSIQSLIRLALFIRR